MTPFIVGLSTPPPFLMFLTNNYDHTNCNTQFTICFKRSANRLSSQTVMSKFAIAQTVQPVRLDVISSVKTFLLVKNTKGGTMSNVRGLLSVALVHRSNGTTGEAGCD
jgi:hypothetical protein